MGLGNDLYHVQFDSGPNVIVRNTFLDCDMSPKLEPLQLIRGKTAPAGVWSQNEPGSPHCDAPMALPHTLECSSDWLTGFDGDDAIPLSASEHKSCFTPEAMLPELSRLKTFDPFSFNSIEASYCGQQWQRDDWQLQYAKNDESAVAGMTMMQSDMLQCAGVCENDLNMSWLAPQQTFHGASYNYYPFPVNAMHDGSVGSFEESAAPTDPATKSDIHSHSLPDENILGHTDSAPTSLGYLAKESPPKAAPITPSAAAAAVSAAAVAAAAAAVTNAEAHSMNSSLMLQPQSLRHEFNTSTGTFHFHWVVDASKLAGSARTAVSPIIETPFGTPVKFKMILGATSTSDLKGGASFKKARGRGMVSLKCEDEMVDVCSCKMAFRVSIGNQCRGSGAGVEGEHDFVQSRIYCLQDEWNFRNAVDMASKTFVVSLEVLSYNVA